MVVPTILCLLSLIFLLLLLLFLLLLLLWLRGSEMYCGCLCLLCRAWPAICAKVGVPNVEDAAAESSGD